MYYKYACRDKDEFAQEWSGVGYDETGKKCKQGSAIAGVSYPKAVAAINAHGSYYWIVGLFY